MSDPRHEIAAALIDDFSIDPGHYRELDADECARRGITGEGLGENRVFLRGEVAALSLRITGSGGNNRIFLNQGVGGTLLLGLTGNDGNLFFGRDIVFADQQIGSRQGQDFIAVGNDVATTGAGHWISGLRAGAARPALIVGDSCLLSRDVVLRNSDGHPLFDQHLKAQCNTPERDLVIEPHVWLGERSAVLKNVRIGAFSIIGFGSVVTRDVPRHHSTQGVPATSKAITQRVWAWDDSIEGIDRARHFLERYPPLNSEGT